VKVFWFAGKQLIGKAAPNQVLEWSATAGDYGMTALDDHGRAGSHSVVVRSEAAFVERNYRFEHDR
jgi:membrane carboxypeptidase/penicillin-binding protein PbpC